MNYLIKYVYHQASKFKTEKSIYNIITGKKSHQTFFDAVSLNVLSLFGILPDLTFDTFKTLIYSKDNDTPNVHQGIPTSNQITFRELQFTFIALQLVIQTLSNQYHNHLSFMPLTSNTAIHKKVKVLYHNIQSQDAFQNVEDEIYDLFEQLNHKNETSILHYFLSGYQETMYTFKQVSLIHNLSEDDMMLLYYIDLLNLYELLQNTNRYPNLNQCLFQPIVSKPVWQTYHYLTNGYHLNEIANILNVTMSTIEDHILDLFIKGYLNNYSFFLRSSLEQFVHYYRKHPNLKLKHYKSLFNEMSYFEIKLSIVGLSRGDINAN
ncbi:helix-turn-helix domain-containing protein [Staphylococcus canis]|uniref:Helicase Helix-turn-helix domain-containing protein n=1 Tax=Staphylococcus canis TaxID=2724942 RepID=A0ABS0T9C2_9STAP|nr:helix-turn-helix domain-containing protein [Staphylococcus canis]MBI5975344.1 hypothetical protein [Staphylococcus canis]